MKFISLAFKVLLCTTILSQSVIGEEITLPVITKPAILDEGTQRELTPDQIAELLPWAKNSKIFLTDALDNLQGLPSSLKVERLLESIKQVQEESGAKTSELFMRYILNRSLAVNDILSKEMDADAVGSVDVKLRVLTLSIEMAIKYFDVDVLLMNKKSAAPFKDFGIEYFNFLTNLGNSIFDASAQYNIHRTALEFLQWDLYRDLNNKSFAPQIVKINNGLKFFPQRKMRDSESIALIRQMKKLTAGMNLIIREDRVEVPRDREESRPEIIPGTDLKIGSKVMFNGHRADVVAVLESGQVMVKQVGSSTAVVVDVKALAYLEGCAEGFCVGDEIIDATGYYASITAMTKDKVFYIFRSGWNYSERRGADQLAKREGCSKDGFCVEEEVIDHSGYPATVTGIKNDNKVYVFRKGWDHSEMRDSSILAKTKGCANRNICVGDAVYLMNGFEATVTGIINATTVRVFAKDWSYSEVRTITALGTTK